MAAPTNYYLRKYDKPCTTGLHRMNVRRHIRCDGDTQERDSHNTYMGSLLLAAYDQIEWRQKHDHESDSFVCNVCSSLRRMLYSLLFACIYYTLRGGQSCRVRMFDSFAVSVFLSRYLDSVYAFLENRLYTDWRNHLSLLYFGETRRHPSIAYILSIVFPYYLLISDMQYCNTGAQ